MYKLKKQLMEFDYYIWNEIKEFMFHRHLWNKQKYRNYSKILKILPKANCCDSNINLIDYDSNLIVTHSNHHIKFIRIYSNFIWNSFNIKLVTFICLQKSDQNFPTILTDFLKDLHYDVYIK